MTTAISQHQSLESLLRCNGWPAETFAFAHRGRKKKRAHIARELGDRTLLGLCRACLLLRNAVGEKAGGSPIKASVGRALALLRGVINQARAPVQGLRPSRPAFGTLEWAFASLGKDSPRRVDVLFRIFVNGKPRNLNPAVQERVYLIGREALLNAFRHSQATTIEAEIEYLPRRLRVFVRDDGCGIDPKLMHRGRDSHRGLAGMQERAADIGATVRVWSRRGDGTEVEISVSGT